MKIIVGAEPRTRMPIVATVSSFVMIGLFSITAFILEGGPHGAMAVSRQQEQFAIEQVELLREKALTSQISSCSPCEIKNLPNGWRVRLEPTPAGFSIYLKGLLADHQPMIVLATERWPAHRIVD